MNGSKFICWLDFFLELFVACCWCAGWNLRSYPKQDACGGVGWGIWQRLLSIPLPGWQQNRFYSSHKRNAFKIPQVTLSPLFVMRSHLPEPMLMKVSTAKTNSSSVLHLQGRAHEQQLYGLEPNSWHHLNFQFSGSADWSSPSVPLNSTLIELANMVTYDNSAEEEGIVGDSWPYCKNAQSYRCGEGTFLPFSLVFR